MQASSLKTPPTGKRRSLGLCSGKALHSWGKREPSSYTVPISTSSVLHHDDLFKYIVVFTSGMPLLSCCYTCAVFFFSVTHPSNNITGTKDLLRPSDHRTMTSRETTTMDTNLSQLCFVSHWRSLQAVYLSSLLSLFGFPAKPRYEQDSINISPTRLILTGTISTTVHRALREKSCII